ncbi:hypothetical protein [Herbaspirillum sp. CAH-3]|uniref:hypothetical protein n=1 Tax=Herbaspirillum sp. CAH-3 TaxID=2605746 RepID=UPI0012AC7D99|nr:hypothetical protein [Herbaspirillum sp. CAH-3]MRT30865.1 hypothetical protein [Herbaspirillum sp. CAH-3]
MDASQKLKHMILLKLAEWDGKELPLITAENIDRLYDEDDQKWDAINELRGGEVETGLPTPYARYFEVKAVAAKYIDGTWVGWNYYYGGGKHSNPEAIEWIDEAYDVAVKEEEKLVLVREFSKIAVAQEGGAA